MTDKNFTPARKGELVRAESVRRLYAHVIPDDRDWTDALKPEYWFLAMGASTGNNAFSSRLEAGDRVEVLTTDRQVCFELTILDANAFSRPQRICFVARPICPRDLPLPSGVIGEKSQYRIRPSRTGGYEIIDGDGTVVSPGLATKHAAQLNLATLDRISAAASAKADVERPSARRREAGKAGQAMATATGEEAA